MASQSRRFGPQEGAPIRRLACCVESSGPMDELLRDFLTETGESLDVVDVQLVRFEQEPNNTKILDNIFRLVHTIKGTCGFLGLPRLETLTHAAETLMGNFRGGRPVTGEAVTLVLATIDRIKGLPDELERTRAEPGGDDQDLSVQLQNRAAARSAPTRNAASTVAPEAAQRTEPAPPVANEPASTAARADVKPAAD